MYIHTCYNSIHVNCYVYLLRVEYIMMYKSRDMTTLISPIGAHLLYCIHVCTLSVQSCTH